MSLVAIGTLEQGEHIVDVEFVVLDFNLAEAMLERGGFEHFALGVESFYDYGVEVGSFGSPESGISHIDGYFALAGYLSRARLDGFAFGVEQCYAHGGIGFGAMACEFGTHHQFGFRKVAAGKLRTESHIGELHLRRSHKENVAIDTTQAKHILVLEITAIAPAIHFHGYGVNALLHITGDVETGIVGAVLAIPHSRAVDPHIERAVHAVEVHKHLLAFPLGRKGKSAHIRAHSIGFVYYGIAVLRLYKRRIVVYGIHHIGVDGSAVAEHFPITWHIDFRPTVGIVIFGMEFHRARLRVRRPVELPLAVEAHDAARAGIEPRFAERGIAAQFVNTRKRRESAAIRQFVDADYVLVFPIVVAMSLKSYSARLHRAFFHSPLLALGVVGRELVEGFAKLSGIAVAEAHIRSQASECVSIGVNALHHPLLIDVAAVVTPLNGGLLGIARGIVDGHPRHNIHYVIHIFAHLDKLPSLRGTVGRSMRQEYAAFVSHTALIVDGKAIGAEYRVGLLGTEILRLHAHTHKQDAAKH